MTTTIATAEATTEISWLFQRFQDDDNEYGLFLNYSRVTEAAKTDEQVPLIVVGLYGRDDVGRIVWIGAPGPDAPWGVGEIGEYRPEWSLPDWWTDAELGPAALMTYAERERFLETLRADPQFARQAVAIFRDAMKGGADDD